MTKRGRRRILMLTNMRSRGSSLTKRKRMKQEVKRRSHLLVKGQRARQRHWSLQKILAVKRTKVEHLVTHLLLQRIMVSV